LIENKIIFYVDTFTKNFHLVESRHLWNKVENYFLWKVSWKGGNKYYESKNGKRWIIYANSIDASKIPVEWYSWMHFMHNKIEKNHNFEKYDWQKPHQSNLTGTEEAYYPNKNKDGIKKKYSSWKE